MYLGQRISLGATEIIMASKQKGGKTAKKSTKMSDKMKQFRETPKKDGPAAQRKPRAKKTKEPKAAVEKTKDGVQAGSKAAQVIELLDRKGGATVSDIAALTDWLRHTIRGFISGMLVKKLGLKVESTKDENGVRSYAITR